uniref:Uncharacterized protein n=1 Tax=Biomphalaria glabrata TaxID=6526 RepID=A0A2C9KA08_BIOGL
MKLFEGISLSANTVSSRITESATNVQQQLIAAAKNFVVYSIALDESTGVTDTAYCAVFICGVNENLNIVEELLDLLPIIGTTNGRDVFQEPVACIDRYGLPWEKLVSVATDGAPAMCSEKQGNTALFLAANGNHKEVARVLVDAKCEIDLPNSKQITLEDHLRQYHSDKMDTDLKNFRTLKDKE